MTFLKQNLLRIAVILLMLGALGDHPYSYYQFLRWATSICSFYLAFMAYNDKRNSWTWIFTIIAILFNPLAPFYLDKETWKFYNIVTAVIYFISIFKFKIKSYERE